MVPQCYHSGLVVHIHPAEAAAGRSLDQQAPHSLVDQGILLLNVDWDIAPDQQMVDYTAYSRLAVGQDKQECFAEVVGNALAVHVTDIDHIQVAVDLEMADFADRRAPVGVWGRTKCWVARQYCGVAVQNYRMKCRHAQMESVPTYSGSPGRSLDQSSFGYLWQWNVE